MNTDLQILPGAMLCVATNSLAGRMTRWALTGDTRCYTAHNEPVMYPPSEDFGDDLATLYIASPRSSAEPLTGRLASFAQRRERWVAVEPSFVRELGPADMLAWRLATSRIWHYMIGCDYSERNLWLFARRILDKWIPGSFRRKGGAADYASFHCTQGALMGYRDVPNYGWTPPSLVNVAGYRLSPKSIEASIRAGEWRYVCGHDDLWQDIVSAEQ